MYILPRSREKDAMRHHLVNTGVRAVKCTAVIISPNLSLTFLPQRVQKICQYPIIFRHQQLKIQCERFSKSCLSQNQTYMPNRQVPSPILEGLARAVPGLAGESVPAKPPTNSTEDLRTCFIKSPRWKPCPPRQGGKRAAGVSYDSLSCSDQTSRSRIPTFGN